MSNKSRIILEWSSYLVLLLALVAVIYTFIMCMNM